MISPGLCAACQHARLLRSGKGSHFVRCGRSDREADYPRYPRLPVMRCAGFEQLPGDQSEATITKLS